MVYVLAGLMVTWTAGMFAIGIWLRSEIQEGKHLRDLLTQSDEREDVYRFERDDFARQCVVLTKKYDDEHALRLAVEKQRDRAIEQYKESFVERVKTSSVAESARMVSDLFATTLGMSKLPQADDPPAGDGGGSAAGLQPSSVTRTD